MIETSRLYDRRKSRRFKVPTITRKDVFALTREAAKISGLSYVMDAYKEEAEKVLSGK